MAASDGRPPRPTPPWMFHVKAGDLLTPDGLWNRTERPRNHLPDRVQVLEVWQERNSQHGIMVRVHDVSGCSRRLSIGWFTGPA